MQSSTRIMVFCSGLSIVFLKNLAIFCANMRLPKVAWRAVKALPESSLMDGMNKFTLLRAH